MTKRGKAPAATDSPSHQGEAAPSTGEVESKTKRLGIVLRKLREERGMSAAGLAKQTGLSRSYLNYLETGKFAEVGLDKFSRVVSALGLSADRVLREAGYLPVGAEGLPEARTYLATQYGLSLSNLEHALAFLEFLASRDQADATKRAPRGRKP